MEDMQIYTYEGTDRAIKLAMGRSAANMVEIGCLLRRMMENKLWVRQFSCFDEYLNKELHMDYTMATRFIKANKKYSDSEDGTKLDAKWKDFSQSVLIEMLNMPPELEEKVTPDMTVKQVREVKKQKKTKMKPEIVGILASPYCAACKEPLDETEQKCPNCGQEQDWEWYNRFFGNNDQPQDNGAEVATSQQSHQEKEDEPDVIDVDYREVPEELSAYGLTKTIYPAGSLITTGGCGDKYTCFLCAQECNIRQKERQCCEATCGNPFGCQTMEKLADIRAKMGERCQFINDGLARKTAGSGIPDPCCKECALKSECDFCCGMAGQQALKENLATSQDFGLAKPVLPDEEYPEYMPADRTAEKRETRRQAFLGVLREHMDRTYILTERGEYDKAVNKIKSIEVTIKKVQEISETEAVCAASEEQVLRSEAAAVQEGGTDEKKGKS